MVAHQRNVLFHQVVKKFDSKVNLHEVTLEKCQEVMAMHHVGEGHKGIVFIQVTRKDLCQFQEISHQTYVRPDYSQHFDHIDCFDTVGHLVNRRQFLPLFVVHLVQDWSYAQGISNDNRPQRLATVIRQTVFPQGMEEWCLNGKHITVFPLNFIDFLICFGFTATECPNSLNKILILLVLRSFQSVVPVVVPMRKDISVPYLLNLLFVEVGPVEILSLFSVLLSFLNQQGS